MNKALILLVSVAMGLASCKNDCLKCSGSTYPREICESDYLEKSDFQAEIAAYEATPDGVCE